MFNFGFTLIEKCPFILHVNYFGVKLFILASYFVFLETIVMILFYSWFWLLFLFFSLISFKNGFINFISISLLVICDFIDILSYMFIFDVTLSNSIFIISFLVFLWNPFTSVFLIPWDRCFVHWLSLFFFLNYAFKAIYFYLNFNLIET